MSNASNRATVLGQLAKAVENSVKSRDAEIAAVRAADVLQDDTKMTVQTTRVAMSLRVKDSKLTAAKARKDAARILALPNANSKAPEKRTEAEDTIVNAARKYWSRLLAAADVKSTDSRAGNSNAKKSEPRPSMLDKDDVPADNAKPKPAAPAFATAAQYNAWLDGQAAMLIATTERAGKVASASRQKLIAKFAADLAKLTK